MKTQTLFLNPQGEIIRRIDDFIYTPLANDTIMVDNMVWHIHHIYDEVYHGYLVRRISLKKA